MKMKISLIAFIAICLFQVSFINNTSDYSTWEKLGSRKVSYKLDRDVIHVGAYDGLFKKLKIAVTGGSINMHKLIIEYGNGEKDIIPMKYNFNKNSSSRIIDLEGRKRIIKNITFFYDTKNRSRRKATVHVFGGR